MRDAHQEPVIEDRWLRELTESAAALSVDPTSGENVLSVKLGYNPNSSSVGSVITTLLWSATMGAAVVNIAAALIQSAAKNGVTVVGAPPEPAEGE